MNDMDEVNETEQKFLIRLYEQTGGDGTLQASMYAIGELLGLDRRAASRAAEGLIGLELVEIRTLSGGIAISAQGVQMVQSLVGPPESAEGAAKCLGDGPLVDAAGRRAVQQVAADIKKRTGALGLNFDDLSALMADLKTLDAQLESPRPKTAIVRECLRSIQDALSGLDVGAAAGRLNSLLCT